VWISKNGGGKAVISGVFSSALAFFRKKNGDFKKEVILADKKDGPVDEGDSLDEDKEEEIREKEDLGQKGEKEPPKTTEKDKKGRSWKEDKKKVLESIIEEAKKGGIKHQELYLKYIDHFLGGDNGDEDVIYTAEFVDDEKKKT
jgi:hypothetical protein